MNITNDKVTEYINGFYKPLTPALRDLREEAEKNWVPVILKETESFLISLIRMQKPQRILEVGTAVGYSSSCFAFAFEGCYIDTIEAKEENYHIAKKNIEELGLAHRIAVHLGDGAEVMETLHRKGCEKFDFVFIDASKSHYKEFWDSAVKLCKKGSVIVSDNVLMKAMSASDEYDTNGKHKTNIRRMREYLQYIHSLDYCTTSICAVGDGLAISIITE